LEPGFAVPPLFIPKLLEYHKAGQFPFEKMLRFYRFDEIDEAFAASRACTTCTTAKPAEAF
jgi:aryl-alcohol dehydrogenase